MNRNQQIVKIKLLSGTSAHLGYSANISKAIIVRTWCATGIPETVVVKCSIEESWSGCYVQSLEVPSFTDPIQNCFLKVVNYDKFPTSNTLRRIHSFSPKMKSWWSVQVVIFNIHGWWFDARFTPWCPFEPETSDIDYASHISDISSKSKQNHPTWILTAATPNANKTWYLADHGVVGAVLLPDEYSPIHAWGELLLLALEIILPKLPLGWSMKLRSSKIYGLDLEVMSRSFAHDVIPLKDSHDVELTN